MQISAKIIAHSKSAISGKEIVTFELEYPRFIHSELMTHRLFSRNAASSRAIPVEKMIEAVRTSPAMPVHWGKNQPGMQAKEECNAPVWLETASRQSGVNQMVPYTVQEYWHFVADLAADSAGDLDKAGYHKQIVNRILEPFQWTKTIVTATEWGNFFWLRNHPDAQPEIKRLAECMWEALQVSHPNIINPGEWHVPYVASYRTTRGDLVYTGQPQVAEDGNGFAEMYTLQDALAISSSCCAQVSYRKLDDSLEKAKMVYDRLVGSVPVHASPFEHQATPMDATVKHDCSMDGAINLPSHPHTWDEGITHVDKEGNFWSGNFKNWIQHRQLIPNNVCCEYPSQYEE